MLFLKLWFISWDHLWSFIRYVVNHFSLSTWILNNNPQVQVLIFPSKTSLCSPLCLQQLAWPSLWQQESPLTVSWTMWRELTSIRDCHSSVSLSTSWSLYFFVLWNRVFFNLCFKLFQIVSWFLMTSSLMVLIFIIYNLHFTTDLFFQDPFSSFNFNKLVWLQSFERS